MSNKLDTLFLDRDGVINYKIDGGYVSSIEEFIFITHHSKSSIEKHFEEESDEFYEFVMEYGYDREDDWFSDRKGGYEVEWSFVEE